MREKIKSLKWIGSQGVIYIFLQHVFLEFFDFLQEVIMVDGGVSFELFSGDSFFR